MGYLYDVTFRRQDKANPVRSVQGCLLATAGMVAITALALWAGGERFLTGGPEQRRMRVAERAVERISAALERLAHDAGVVALADLFDDPEHLSRPTLEETLAHQTAVFAELLTLGRGSKAPLRPGVRGLLAPGGYIELAPDPWGSAYHIFAGPWSHDRWARFGIIPFRTYLRPAIGDPVNPVKDDYVVARTDGTPIGHPAPFERLAYVFSPGRDGAISQHLGPAQADAPPEQKTGGDDINNWDPERTWRVFYERADQAAR